MRLQILAAAVATLATLAAGAASAAPAGPQGRWLTASGNVIVDVEPCGPSLCGTIVKVLANRSMEGGAPMASSVPGVGLKILTGFQRQGDGPWTGRLYNRENGKTYDCQLSLENRDQLKVRAYVVLPLIGKTQVWRRMP